MLKRAYDKNLIGFRFASPLTESAQSTDPFPTHINSLEDKTDAQCVTIHNVRKKKARRERARRNISADKEGLLLSKYTGVYFIDA